MVFRNIKTTSLLVTITILSLFSGISLNGQWAWPYELAFFETPRIWRLFLLGMLPQHTSIIALTLHTFSTVLFVIFPFVYNRIIRFPNWFMVVGLIFLFAQFELAGIFAIIFLPFTIVWIITLLQVKKLQNAE